MNPLIFAFLIFQTVLTAENISSSISSKNASYNGNKLFLQGDVKLDHEFGEMSADEAYLEKDEKLKDFLFSLIHLKKDVLLHFKEHGEILCDIANLDFHTLKGQFLPKSGEKVVYTELLEKVKGEKRLLKLLSNLAQIKISKNEEGSEYRINNVEALKEVLVEYGNDFSLKADKAVFENQSTSSIVTAYPEENSRCVLSHGPDQIAAGLIQFDLQHSKLTLHHVNGVLVSNFFPQVQKDEIHFQSNQLTWDHLHGLLKLQGDVVVQEGSFAMMKTDDEIELTQIEKESKRLLKTITSKGNTALKYTDPKMGGVHQLFCHGPITIDRESLSAVLESPKSEEGVEEEMQISYEHESMAIRADKADIHYQVEEKESFLSSIFLQGNVRLSSLKPDQSYRIALADNIEFSPLDNTLVLSAKNGKKVLFWDAGDQLSISANQVRISKDPITGKDMVKGLGRVKFAFTTVEEGFLKKIFPFYEPPQG